MHIVLTTVSAVILICIALAMRRIERLLGQCEDHANDAEAAKVALVEDRSRLTSLERDLEATRRELRKTSGAFYAHRAAYEEWLEQQPDDDDGPPEEGRLGYGPHFDPNQKPLPLAAASVCENWSAAQTLGPKSEAAKCECLYCMTRREERRALRAALVPKTVQGQAEVAKLNAGKP